MMKEESSKISQGAIDNLEKLRKKANVFLVLIFLPVILFIGVTAICLKIAIAHPEQVLFQFLIVIAFFGMAAGLWGMGRLLVKSKKAFISTYKLCVVNMVLKNHFDHYKLEPEKYITKEEIDNAGIFNRDAYSLSGEDLITGEYNSVSYKQSDIYAFYYKNQREHKDRVEIAKGRLAVFDYGKEIDFAIAVVPKLYIFANTAGMSKIKTENVEFNKMYNVYCGDSHTAFYVLTPQLMEYIMELGKKGQIYLRFQYGKLYVLQNNVKGVFEPDRFKPFDADAETTKAWNDMSQLLGIIDTLKLNRDIEEKNMLKQAEMSDTAFEEEPETSGFKLKRD